MTLYTSWRGSVPPCSSCSRPRLHQRNFFLPTCRVSRSAVRDARDVRNVVPEVEQGTLGEQWLAVGSGNCGGEAPFVESWEETSSIRCH